MMTNILFKFQIRVFVKYSLFFIVLLICAGNVTNSFFSVSGFNEKYKGSSLSSIAKGTADRPFVFRSTIPGLIKNFVDKLDNQDQIVKLIKEYALDGTYFSNVSFEQSKTNNAVIFHTVMFQLVYWSFFVTLLIIAKLSELICQSGYFQKLFTVILFCIMYPLTFQGGAFYYDFFEILGLFSAVLFFLSGKFFICTVILWLFSFNKETLFLFPIYLYFLHSEETDKFVRIKWLFLGLVGCLMVRYFITSQYENNPGGVVEHNWLINLKFWLNPTYLFGFANHIGKGIFTPLIENIFLIIPLIVWFHFGWKVGEKKYKKFVLASLLPTFCLFLLFGWRDEFRALSLAFPSLFIIFIEGFPDLRSWLEYGS